jgi:phosphoadenosine phosphosulfate reductase
MNPLYTTIQSLNEQTPENGLAFFANLLQQQAVFSTSFGIEDQVITYMIAQQQLPIEIFTLDTGRLFAETYTTWSNTLQRLPISIKTYYPNTAAVENFVATKGPNSFYESVENRKQCCYIRKVEPLQRALQGKQVWITGIRAEQSPNRDLNSAVEWDEANQIIKYHPLLHWSFDDVKQYVAQHNVSYNPLHDKGFVSIGCAPCTRAIQAGEDFRAGRWWWEDNSKKECGLHVHSVTEKQ